MVNPKAYRRMTPEQTRRAVRKTIAFHRDLAIAAVVGTIIAGAGLAIDLWRLAG